MTYDWDRVEGELSSLNRTLKRVRTRARDGAPVAARDPSGHDAIVARVRRLIGEHEHVLAGPWAGEIGYELLYWIPMLRRLALDIPELAERLTVCSRGGVDSWYADLTPRYLELFDLMPPDEIARRRRFIHREASPGQLPLLTTPVGVKHGRSRSLENTLVEIAKERMGSRDVAVLDPGLLRIPKRKQNIFDVYGTTLEPAPITPPETTLDLPERFAAVRFYAGGGTPDAVNVVAAVREIVKRLADKMPVVSMDAGLRLDHHEDFDLPGVIRLAPCAPAENLGRATAVIARASLFVGSYGGFSYIAPHVGVPTIAWLAQPGQAEGVGYGHLGQVRRLFASPAFGEYVVVTEDTPTELLDVLGAVSGAGKA